MKNYPIKILSILEEQSTCSRIKVGALLVKDNRIISSGWNGTSSKKLHCSEVFAGLDFGIKINDETHKKFSHENEIHAEINCLMMAAKYGIATEHSELYCSFSPCYFCAKAIIAAGIKKIFYKQVYDREIDAINFLKENNIEIEQI